MGLEATTKALLDSGVIFPRSNPCLSYIVLSLGITYDAIEAAFVGYVYGASTCGQAALYQLGLTGIPITNVNNNCATGSTALFHAATLIRAGEARCALTLGFERMAPGSLGGGKNDAWSVRPPKPHRPASRRCRRRFARCGSWAADAARVWGRGGGVL
jgi:sterol carrier protein 2